VNLDILFSVTGASRWEEGRCSRNENSYADVVKAGTQQQTQSVVSCRFITKPGEFRTCQCPRNQYQTEESLFTNQYFQKFRINHTLNSARLIIASCVPPQSMTIDIPPMINLVRNACTWRYVVLRILKPGKWTALAVSCDSVIIAGITNIRTIPKLVLIIF
jgi:hypothetical protein